MTALRPVLASALLAVLTAGGLVLPSVHEAAHTLETAEERADHAATHHGEAGDTAETPCPPPAHEVDCAVCTATWTASEATESDDRLGADTAALWADHADRVRTITAFGAGARAPPAG